MRTLRRLLNPSIIEIISEVYMLVAFVLLLWYMAILLQGNAMSEPEYIQPTLEGEAAYVSNAD